MSKKKNKNLNEGENSMSDTEPRDVEGDSFVAPESHPLTVENTGEGVDFVDDGVDAVPASEPDPLPETVTTKQETVDEQVARVADESPTGATYEEGVAVDPAKKEVEQLQEQSNENTRAYLLESIVHTARQFLTHVDAEAPRAAGPFRVKLTDLYLKLDQASK